MIYTDEGVKPYMKVLALQEELHRKRAEGLIEDTVIFCEHTPVFTIGKRDSSADWISDLKTIAGEGIDVIKTSRGGRITYHGPGQLVAYFIINIAERKLGVKDFVSRIEDVCAAALADFGIKAERDVEHPGLWANGKKIVAIGFHISQNVSMHGIALNVSPDMDHYRHIVPCGIKDKGVTSMKELLGRDVPMSEVRSALKSAIDKNF